MASRTTHEKIKTGDRSPALSTARSEHLAAHEPMWLFMSDTLRQTLLVGNSRAALDALAQGPVDHARQGARGL